MSFLKRYLMAAVGLMLTAVAVAGPYEDGRRLYLSHRYEAAIEKLTTALRRAPRDGNANYYMGASLSALGRHKEALPYLKKAAASDVLEAYPLLVAADIDCYNPEQASTHLEAWRSLLNSKHKQVPAKYHELATRVMNMKNMLARVEKIQILDSLVVPAGDFFAAYRLSAPAGRILPPQAVRRYGSGIEGEHLSVAFMPENRTEILWSQADSSGIYNLYGAGILDDGTPDHPGPLDSNLSLKGNAAFPFLLPDGATLYYASDGEGSLGGYDIFMTRRETGDEGDTYFQPQNLGMPYNSPYDDYMLAIDEYSGLGWFATDRNQIPDSVTVYVFAPSEMRVNVSPSDPHLKELAQLSDISLTRTPGVDYSEMLAGRLAQTDGAASMQYASFSLDIGGITYLSLSDFRNNAARSAMVEYLGAEATLKRHLANEQSLRERYRRGDRTVAMAILESEEQTAAQRVQLRQLRNAVIRAEQTR